MPVQQFRIFVISTLSFGLWMDYDSLKCVVRVQMSSTDSNVIPEKIVPVSPPSDPIWQISDESIWDEA